jgi:hypothetical protein
MNKWFDSPAVDPELKSAYLRTRALLEQVNSNPEHRLGAFEDLVERLLRLAENRCAECGAPIPSLAGTYCSEQCADAKEVQNLY